MTRIYVIAAVLAALSAFGTYLYLDGRSDAKRDLEAAQKAARIEDLKAARKRRDETENLSDDDLRKRLLERLLGPR